MNWLGEQRYGETNKGRRIGWMISYADMMTIILTFMILLLSISTIAQTKYEVLVEEFTGQRVGNLHDVRDTIDEIVEQAALQAEVETFLDDDGLHIEFSNALLFETGSAELRDEARSVFMPIKEHLATGLGPQYGLIVEGYTDDVPISTADFRSNWELSTARAIHVKEALIGAGVDPRRLSVQGFGETRPATDIDLLDPQAIAGLTEEELEEIRSANRRVVIRIDTLPARRVEHILSTSAANLEVAPNFDLLPSYDTAQESDDEGEADSGPFNLRP